MTEAFGKRVTEARLNLAAARKAEVSRVAIGRALDVSGATVGRWEKGQKEPGLATIMRLAEFLEVDPGELAFGQPISARGIRPDEEAVIPSAGQDMSEERLRGA